MDNSKGSRLPVRGGNRPVRQVTRFGEIEANARAASSAAAESIRRATTAGTASSRAKVIGNSTASSRGIPNQVETRLKRQRSPVSKPPVKRGRPEPAVPTRGTTARPAQGTAARKPLSGSRNTTVANEPQNKKRAKWDVKGRLEDLEVEFKTRTADGESRIRALEEANAALKGTVAEKENMYSTSASQLSQLEARLKAEQSLVQELEEKARQSARQMSDLQSQNAQLECQISQLERQKKSLTSDLNAQEEEVAALKVNLAKLSCLRTELEASRSEASQLTEEVNGLKGKVGVLESDLSEHAKKLREEETMRRKLHNTIQELKGNVRVFCRVRPLLGDEALGQSSNVGNHMEFPTHKCLELRKPSSLPLDESSMMNRSVCSGKGDEKATEFSFDYVFSPSSSQALVFDEISQLVQSALDGYNVSIFAYGQTGSGKTYTMQGPPLSEVCEDNQGMIPRSMEQVFNSAKELEEKGWKYEMDASFLEIYNETIHDLLGKPTSDVKHEIKLTGPKGTDVTVSNLTTIRVTSEAQVQKALVKAMSNRAVAETKCNERSSRSHCVFSLKIVGKNTITTEECAGTLHLIDLAGSERLKDSGSQGARLKETQAINKSLSALGNVIMAIANKDGHIPFRNSKLTHFLQNSLGGNAKTLMFVNLSPREENYLETLNSLRFATKVNQCEIGTAKKNKK